MNEIVPDDDGVIRITISQNRWGPGKPPEPKKTCPQCTSDNLSWFVWPGKSNQVSDGRLRLHDIQVSFVLWCLECSDILEVLDADTFMLAYNTSLGLNYE